MNDLGITGAFHVFSYRCEPNYAISRFIAEPINTVSNLSFIVFGILGASHELRQRSKKSYIMLHSTIVMVGIGSMLFHGTLTTWGQQLDELPMVWHLLTALYCLNRKSSDGCAKGRGLLIGSLVGYAVIFSIGHLILRTTTAFQVHFGFLLGVALSIMFRRFHQIDAGQNGSHIITLFSMSGAFAFACWLLDYHGCAYVSQLPINPHGHMWWHIGMGYSAYCSVVMLKIFECAEAGKMLDVKYWCGLPFTYRTAGVTDVEYGSENCQIF